MSHAQFHFAILLLVVCASSPVPLAEDLTVLKDGVRTWKLTETQEASGTARLQLNEIDQAGKEV